MDDKDFFENADATDMVEASGTELKEFVREAVRLTYRIEEVELELNECRSRLNELRSKDLPNLMMEQGMNALEDADTGFKFVMEHAANGALPRDPEKRNAILEKLKPLGVDEITSDTVEFRFAVGDNRPELLLGFAEEHELSFSRSIGVHAGRMAAWLKEKISQGYGAEITDAGIWHGRHVKMTKPRGKKE